MVETRSRTYDTRSQVTGSLEYFWPMKASYTGDGLFGSYGECDDTVGNWLSANPFDVAHRVQRKVILNGEYMYRGSVARKFTEYPCDMHIVPADSRAYWPDPDLAALAQDAVAKTNPSAADISLPVAIGELKDLPDLVRDLGYGVLLTTAKRRSLRKHVVRQWLERSSGIAPRSRTLKIVRDASTSSATEYLTQLIKGLAMGNLTYRFGIRPMASDVSKLLQFQRLVEKRWKYLERLRTEKRVRRRVRLGTFESTEGPVNRTLQSRGAVVSAQETIHYELSQWATVAWQAEWDGVPGAPKFIENTWMQAEKLVLGLTSYEAIQASWELLPWSWLSDWFTGYGQIIQALNNTVGARPVEICYMATTSSWKTYKVTSCPSWVELSDVPFAKEVRKVRIVVPIGLVYTPLVRMPAFNSGQWSILGSLAVLNGGR